MGRFFAHLSFLRDWICPTVPQRSDKKQVRGYTGICVAKQIDPAIILAKGTSLTCVWEKNRLKSWISSPISAKLEKLFGDYANDEQIGADFPLFGLAGDYTSRPTSFWA
jgi:hypothetical protein